MYFSFLVYSSVVFEFFNHIEVFLFQKINNNKKTKHFFYFLEEERRVLWLELGPLKMRMLKS